MILLEALCRRKRAFGILSYKRVMFYNNWVDVFSYQSTPTRVSSFLQNIPSYKCFHWKLFFPKFQNTAMLSEAMNGKIYVHTMNDSDTTGIRRSNSL